MRLADTPVLARLSNAVVWVVDAWHRRTAGKAFAADFGRWFAIRIWAILSGMMIVPYPSGHALFEDVDLYDRWAHQILQGTFPVYDVKWQYPPLAAIVFVIAHSIFAHRWGFILLALAADWAIMHAIVRDTKRRNDGNRLPIWIWVATPLIMGPIVLGRYDVFPTACTVLALLVVSNDYARGALWSLGTLLKLWPALGLLSVKRGQHYRVAFAFTLIALGGSLLLAQWWPASFSFLRHERSRGLQVESVAALPLMIWNAGPGNVDAEFQYGSLEVLHINTVPIALVMTAIAAVFYGLIALWHIQGRLEAIPAGDIMLIVVLVAMISSRVLSPQYNLWLMGIVAVCAFTPQPNFHRILAYVSLSALAAQLLFPVMYSSFRWGGIAGTLDQALRIYWLCAAAVLCWRGITDRLVPSTSLRFIDKTWAVVTRPLRPRQR